VSGRGPVPLAVAVVHGVGRTSGAFAQELMAGVSRRFRRATGSADGLVVEVVEWAPVLQDEEDRLWARMEGERLRWRSLRRFLLDFAGDAIAYQPTKRRSEVYDAVHEVAARTLARLADRAGATAPLAVVGHSLGSVIASNFLYDLHEEHRRRMLARRVRRVLGHSPLARGETLALLYTTGSPLALWSLRRGGFDRPVPVPSPRLATHHPGLGGEWVNFVDRDDPLAWPLRVLNDAYRDGVTEDRAVSAGGTALGWTPTAHQGYARSKEVQDRIAEGLARTWRAVKRSP
jgi:hypothetical protein